MKIVRRKTFWAGIGLLMGPLFPVGIILIIHGLGLFDNEDGSIRWW